jgi:hypothetical protein
MANREDVSTQEPASGEERAHRSNTDWSREAMRLRNPGLGRVSASARKLLLRSDRVNVSGIDERSGAILHRARACSAGMRSFSGWRRCPAPASPTPSTICRRSEPQPRIGIEPPSRVSALLAHSARTVFMTFPTTAARTPQLARAAPVLPAGSSRDREQCSRT